MISTTGIASLQNIEGSVVVSPDQDKADEGFAILCPHCGHWDVRKTQHPESVALSTEDFRQILTQLRDARVPGNRSPFRHERLLRCRRPRWACPASFEAFVFRTEREALRALEEVPEKWAISRDFRLCKANMIDRWDEKYFCIMFCSEPVPRLRDIELEHLTDPKLLSQAIVGMSRAIQAPLTVYTANVFRPEKQPPCVYWMPVEGAADGKGMIPPRYSRFCRMCRKIVTDRLCREFEEKGISTSNCTLRYGSGKECLGRDAACLSGDWNHCPAFIEARKKYCPCYVSDLALIGAVQKAWEAGQPVSDGIRARCFAGFHEIAFPITVHEHLIAVAMTGQAFSDLADLADMTKVCNEWEYLRGHDIGLEMTKYLLLFEEECVPNTDRGAKFLVNGKGAEEHLAQLRASVEQLEEVATVGYRDVRNRSESAFKQELMGYIQNHKGDKDFFTLAVSHVLSRMKDFWAFRQAGLLRYSTSDNQIALIGASPTGGDSLNFGLPGQPIGQVTATYEQSHPHLFVHQMGDSAEPIYPWVTQILSIVQTLKRAVGIDLPQEGVYLMVSVPLSQEVYAFVLAGRDVINTSRLLSQKPASVSKLCQESILGTCTAVVHEFGNVQALIREHERAWREFSALATHRVGNEISSVGMLLDALHREIENPNELREDWQRHIATMRASVTKAKRMLIGQAKLTAQIKPQLVLTNLRELLRRATVGILFGVGTLNLDEVDSDLSIPIDVDLMDEVFKELAVNAVAAKENGGLVLDIDARLTDTEVEIRLRDNGPGVPRDVEAHIFDPYFTTKSFGSGLGLPTVRRIVESHGGRISLETSSRSGAEFLIVLPFGEPGT